MDSEQAFAPVVTALRRDPNVGQARMFGALGLKTGENFFAMLYKGDLVVKLSADRAAALVGSGEGRHFDPGHGRLMKEWVAVTPRHASRWVALTEEAKAFVASSVMARIPGAAERRARWRPLPSR